MPVKVRVRFVKKELGGGSDLAKNSNLTKSRIVRFVIKIFISDIVY